MAQETVEEIIKLMQLNDPPTPPGQPEIPKPTTAQLLASAIEAAQLARKAVDGLSPNSPPSAALQIGILNDLDDVMQKLVGYAGVHEQYKTRGSSPACCSCQN